MKYQLDKHLSAASLKQARLQVHHLDRLAIEKCKRSADRRRICFSSYIRHGRIGEVRRRRDALRTGTTHQRDRDDQ